MNPHRTDWQIAGSSTALAQGTLPGTQQWTCGSLEHLIKGTVQSQGSGHPWPPLHLDLLPARVLAHPSRAGPSQQGEGNNARILHHPAGLMLILSFSFSSFSIVGLCYNFCVLFIVPFIFLPFFLLNISHITCQRLSAICIFHQ